MIGRQEAQRKRHGRKASLALAIQVVFMVGAVSFAHELTSAISTPVAPRRSIQLAQAF